MKLINSARLFNIKQLRGGSQHFPDSRAYTKATRTNKKKENPKDNSDELSRLLENYVRPLSQLVVNETEDFNHTLESPETEIPLRTDFVELYTDYSQELQNLRFPDWSSMTAEQQFDFWSNKFSWDDHISALNKMIFGHDEWHSLQRQSINAILAKQNLLLCLSAGGGKSLVYQLSTLTNKGAAIIVSPLIALVQDQVQILENLGIKSLQTTSSLGKEALDAVYEEMIKPEISFKFLFVTPEKLFRSRLFFQAASEMYKNNNLSLLVIDEAHCISEWGHDFRPDYRKIDKFRKKFPDVPALALSGTCTPEVRDDIRNQLAITKGCYLKGSLNKTNIWIEVLPRFGDGHEQIAIQLYDYIIDENLTDLCGLIYCLTRREAETVAQILQENGLNCLAYHGKMESKQRSEIQSKWMENEVKLLCTTVAFGLGINKKDVRYVLHTCASMSIEAYFQQVGRAGRDGGPARSILFYGSDDHFRIEQVMSQSSDPQIAVSQDLIASKHEKLDDMIAYCELKATCRHEWLLSYFGEPYKCTAYKDSDICDMCKAKRENEKILAEKNLRRAQWLAEKNEEKKKQDEVAALKKTLLKEIPPEPLPRKRINSNLPNTTSHTPAATPPQAFSDNTATSAAPAATPRPQSPTKLPISSLSNLSTLELQNGLDEAKVEGYLVKKIIELDTRKVLSKNAIRAIAKKRPMNLSDLADIKGVGMSQIKKNASDKRKRL